MKKLSIIASVFVVSALIGTGCGTESSPNDDIVNDTSPPAKTMLRAIHLSPDAPAVDIFANETEPAAVSDLAFMAGTDYLELVPGTYNFDLSPADSGLAGSVLDTGDLNLEEDKFHTAVAYDEVASLKVMPIVDDYDGLEEGAIRVRAIHVATAVGQVDIWNIPAVGAPAALYTDVDFGSVGEYIDLPAGAYRLGFDVDNDENPDLIFQTPALAAGTVINLFAVSQGTDVFLIAQLNDGTTEKISPENVVVPTDKAWLRAIHLSQDAPNVDIFADDTEPAAVTDLAFLEGTGYLELDAGIHNFDIAPAEAGLSASVLDTGDLELEKDKKYTVAAFNYVSYLEVIVLVDDLEDLDAANIRVRPVHLAPAVGQVDIWNIPETGDPAPLYTDVDFKAAGEYMDLPAGAYKLGFDVDNDQVPDLVFQTPDLAAGTVLNLFAVSDGDDVFLIAQTEDGTTARIDPLPAEPMAMIRAIHLSPDAPAVDIFANETEPAVFTGLAFPQGTEYLQVPPGNWNFDISPTETGLAGSVLDTGDLELSDGVHYTAVAYDVVGSLKVMPLVDDFDDLEAGKFRVRAIHTAAGIGQVDIWNIPEVGDPTPLYTDVDFGAVSDYVDLAAGSYTIGFDIDDDGNPDAVFTTPDIEAGTVINLFAVKNGEDVFLIAQLNDGTTVRIDPPVTPPKARLRAIHLSPDAPAVDIFANALTDASIVGLEFPESTEFLFLEAGEYFFDIAPADSGIESSVLTTGNLTLDQDTFYTAVAYDEVASLKVMALAEDFEDLDTGNIRVRAIHAAAGVGQVDIWNIPEVGDPAMLYTDVDYGAAGDYLDIPAGAYKLGIDTNNDAIPDLVFQTPDLPEESIINVFAVKDGADVFLIAQFQDGTTARINPMIP